MTNNTVIVVMVFCCTLILGVDYYLKYGRGPSDEQQAAYNAFCVSNGYKHATVDGSGVLWCVKAHPLGMMVPYDKDVVPVL